MDQPAGVVTPRIIVEYADFTSTLGLYKTDDLDQPASIVSPRIVVEYADSIFSSDLRRPTFKPVPPPENQPPNPPNLLSQYRIDGTVLEVGGTIGDDTVILKGVCSDPDGDRVKLQIELRRLDEYGGQFDETKGGFKESDWVESGSEVTAYAYGLIDGDYHWRARVVDENGEYSDWIEFGDNDISEADFSVPWSFAIITDLHIGWGIPDYGEEGYYDTIGLGQGNYYITERVEKAVEWINKNYIKYSIKFVVVLGDISDTAEYSEFLKAREILNKLEIPYVPIIGNHDIWPYVQKMTSSPDGGILGRWTTIKDKRKNGEPLGDKYFEIVFWKDNLINCKKIENLFDSFLRQEEYKGAYYLQNYAFSYKEFNFICLDFASRSYGELLYRPTNSDLHVETMKWFEEKLRECTKEKVIVFTHYPFSLRGFEYWDLYRIRSTIRKYGCNVINYGGHSHINWVVRIKGEYEVKETESTAQFQDITGGDIAPSGRFIRLVQISEGNICYETLINLDNFPFAINPYFVLEKLWGSSEEVYAGQEITFEAYAKNREREEISLYLWDFGNGEFRQTEEYKYKFTYKNPDTYKVTLKVLDIYGRMEKVSWSISVKEKAKPWWKIFEWASRILPGF